MDRSVYKRPSKPLSIPVKRRRDRTEPITPDLCAPITVDKFTECHVTPSDVAARMVEYLGPVGDFLTLEPSAGTGQLAKALIASGHSQFELTMIERHHALATELRQIGPVIQTCFLEYAEENKGCAVFPRIIMNPPFSQVKKHVAAALSLLGQGGHQEPATLVALVPVTFEHSEAETLERLPCGTFETANVATKIIRIRDARA